jgi:hypothetical protein
VLAKRSRIARARLNHRRIRADLQDGIGLRRSLETERLLEDDGYLSRPTFIDKASDYLSNKKKQPGTLILVRHGK